jgi:hypothetical protein
VKKYKNLASTYKDFTQKNREMIGGRGLVLMWSPQMDREDLLPEICK